MSSYYGYIYITINNISKRKYIGRRKGSFNTKYLGSGVALKDAVLKYGEENFTVEPIFYAFSNEDLNEAEKTIIAQNNACVNEDFYNLAPGGDAWGSTQSHETRMKISKSRMGIVPYNKGIPNPEASKRMKENNPMKNPEIVAKVKMTKLLKNRDKQLSFDFSFTRKKRKKTNKKTFWTYPDGTTKVIYDTKAECKRLGLSYSSIRHKIDCGPYVIGKHKGLSVKRID